MFILWFSLFLEFSKADDFDDYDFSDLKKSPSNPYQYKQQATTYSWNFRAPVSVGKGGSCDIDDCIAESTSTYIMGCHCYGTVGSEKHKILADDKGIQFTYEGDDDGSPKSFVYKLICSKDENQDVTDDGETLTVVQEHPAGCKKSPDPKDDPKNPKNNKKKGLSFGSIMLIIFSVLLVLYFAAGMPLMYFAFKKRGIEMIPFVFFWTSLPRLVIEGVKVLISPCTNKARGFEEMK
ncbi:putative Autophagy-related protein 27 [Monocercomonoides exilis]|uniref:putative Autophagy-related protein 27 n=1 Tax=Monocercomonoides exilis TaxID=2049356 RepID=UPI003559626E|nr:putative Autophagy-related protein 27 [Monocercomonoides exilis]|eukprot:MONOS_13090.1-p1 / transcript=MONOS_13090.1 / gene=MONOS_13090 / organism=Monocercomonoides_exilis_PA203 / gene_product=unspecified product / transcript_product=unspecified product / location=Mono_scaffold00777:5822-6831(+) / protein_length=235 / sequence_SO=supercontig / SO=protein_coding / is_pseudo=false